MNMPRNKEDPATERWTLIRDVGVLQFKLLIDGLRDLMLVPLSLVAGLISLVQSKDGQPGPQFYQLLAWGKQTEIWINLFGAVENSPHKIEQPHPFGEKDIDDIVGRLETFVVDEVKCGGVTTQAKERLDKILNGLQKKNKQT